MAPVVEQHADEIRALCRKYGVRKLELFGSAARDDFDPSNSDVDFFYTFGEHETSDLADRYFDFMEALESLLGLKVDLVSAPHVRNPYFLQVANRHRILLYAA